METPSQLTITPELATKIRDHGAATYPHECCGALLGHDSEASGQRICREVHALFPLVNQREDSPQNRFSVTGEDVRSADKAAADKGLDVVGWYHSHPDHPAQPSQYDREHAWPWYSYIIVSVTNRVPGDMTSWRLRDDRTEFTQEEIGLRNQAAS